MAFPKKNKDIPYEVALPQLGSKDPAYSRTEPVDDTYDYTNQSCPGRMGGDPRLNAAQKMHQQHGPITYGKKKGR